MTFIASLRSELQKNRRTSILYLVLFTSLVIPVILVFDTLSEEPNHVASGWDNYYLEGQMVMTYAFLPLFLVMGSTLLMQVEVRNNTWKQVVASPQSFIHILLSKFLVLLMVALAVLIGHNICMVLGASLLDVLFKNGHYLAYLERWPDILRINLLTYGSMLGIGALTFWLALRFKNFVAPIAIGFLLWLIGPTAAFEFKWVNVDKFVFAIPLTLFSKRYANQELFHQLLSVGYAVLFLSLAYLEFVFTRIKPRSYFRKRIVAPVGRLAGRLDSWVASWVIG